MWKGYYEYLGKRQPATLTVDWFNATSSKVNATFLEASQVELKLTGRPWGISFHKMQNVSRRTAFILSRRREPTFIKCLLTFHWLCISYVSWDLPHNHGRLVLSSLKATKPV